MVRGASVSGFFVLCLALVIISCEAKGRGGRGGGRGRLPRGNPVARGGRGGGRGGVPRGIPVAAAEKEFNVLQFGAVAGGQDDSTQAFMQAWIAACSYTGNAKVVIPQGVFKVAEVIFGGPCKGPKSIQVMGTVKADSDLSNYPDKGWISISHVDGLMIYGEGTFDGQGQNVWNHDNCKTNSDCVHLPASLYLVNVKNARIQWVHLVNSMGFHMHVTGSLNVRITNIDITAPGVSPNTDGIHISKSQTVKIGKSKIATGDDCISIGQGSTNVAINKVVCGPGHGISVGSLGKLANEMDVRGVIVRNCTLTGTTNGVRIKTFAASGPSKASSMLFSNIVMNNVQNPVIIDQYYSGKPTDKPSGVKISDVTYEDIRGTTASPIGVNLMCSKLAPCQNLNFRNINLGGGGSSCTNALLGSYTGIQIPPPCK